MMATIILVAFIGLLIAGIVWLLLAGSGVDPTFCPHCAGSISEETRICPHCYTALGER